MVQVCLPYAAGALFPLRAIAARNVYLSLFLLSCEVCHQPFQVAESSGVPPLPIPNREVKPAHADGTAQVGE